MVRPLLCLVMIVKNEAKTIIETLKSASFLCDHFLVVDTGSTDRTVDIVSDYFDHRGDGSIVHEPFVDFAATRNRSLEIAQKYAPHDWYLMLSGDEVANFHGGGGSVRDQLRSIPLVGTGALEVDVKSGGSTFRSARLISHEDNWRYKGVVHEALYPPQGRAMPVYFPHLNITHTESDPGRKEERLRRDVALLERAVEADPTDARSVFYLANTLRDLGENGKAIVVYEHRIEMGGWWEEKYASCMSLSKIAVLPDHETIMTRAMDAYEIAPHRAEPLFRIAECFYADQEWAMCYLYAKATWERPFPFADRLFVDSEIYAWKAADMVAIAAWHLGEFAFETGYNAAEEASTARPDDARLRDNLKWYERRAAELQKEVG